MREPQDTLERPERPERRITAARARVIEQNEVWQGDSVLLTDSGRVRARFETTNATHPCTNGRDASP